jgi:4-aminobutyrate aminotransferase-like enzyme/Ser/Thr protein kinase RdoA (MazF antagonist)
VRANVLEARPPRFTPDEVAAIAASLFGLDGPAVDLGSERDQTFLIEGERGGVLKISNAGEDPAVLDLETEVILHVARVDPQLPVARPARAGPGEGADAYRATIDGPEGTHFVRLFERLQGRAGGADLPAAAIRAYAVTHARLNLALRSFFHPAAGRQLLWDLQHAGQLRRHLGAIDDRRRRGLVEQVLDRYEERVAPRWPLLRSQVVHGDLNLDNVLLDQHDRICGIVDFGDTSYTAQVGDFAVALASLLRGREGEDVFRCARLAIDGYASRSPFELEELDVLGDLVATRLAAIVTISAWRAERYPENAAYIQAWDDDSWRLLELRHELGAETFSQELGSRRPRAATQPLARRRDAVVGSLLTRLTYRRPVHVVRGEGVWLYDADGRRLLDAYNNVPVVGHCHPRVTEAVVRQTRALNTHARYLYEPLVELAERLLATVPAAAGLDSVMLVNSGSEANDLAWRLATAATGNSGALVTEHAYHGVTSATADLSPEEWPSTFRPAAIERVSPTELAAPNAAVEALQARGVGVAATFLDCGLTSDGILTPPPADLASLVAGTHAAGGLFVADEVQAGHGRSGEHLWSFAHYGLVPDVVTLGKPMGNGYPVAAVITRRDLAESFAFAGRVFSTFGGNPVAAQAALAVLAVIEDEGLVEHAGRVGAHLRDLIRARPLPGVVDVRGLGLLVGVELTDAPLAERVVDSMREDGVLIGRTGPRENVLKIRPPLPFADEHAELVVEALAASLAER